MYVATIKKTAALGSVVVGNAAWEGICACKRALGMNVHFKTTKNNITKRIK
jgi:hypothetical protein